MLKMFTNSPKILVFAKPQSIGDGCNRGHEASFFGKRGAHDHKLIGSGYGVNPLAV
jgi:hypothetical protein